MTSNCTIMKRYILNCFRSITLVQERRFCADNISKNLKVTVVKKKFQNENLVEVVEVKKAANFIKKFNFENKYMFGDLLNKKSSSGRYNSYHRSKCDPEILNNNIGTPIKDVCQNESYFTEDFCGTESLNDTLNSTLLEFPLVDDILSETLENETKLILERNLLRQYLNILSSDLSSIPSVHTVLEETLPPDKASDFQRWKEQVYDKENGYCELINKGSSLHNLISIHLSGTPEEKLDIPQDYVGYWNSLKPIMKNITNVRLLEEHVSHPFLFYNGVVDCVGVHRNSLVVIEWRTLNSLKHPITGMFDGHLEIAAYAGALNFDPKWKYMASKGLVVVAIENGCPASMNYLSEKQLLKYWKLWLKRLSMYWNKVCSEKASVISRC